MPSLDFLNVQPLSPLLMLGVGALVFAFFVVVYRLTLHPLASIPGPTLAAATGLYEIYYQLIKDGGGRYWVEVERMHEKYGPIVRISPWEVHVKDPNWNDVFKLSSKASKPSAYYRSFGTTLNANTTETDQLHRARRGALNVWFSPSNVARASAGVYAMVNKLHSRLVSCTGQVVSLSDAYRSLALDVATNFAFSRPFGHLDKDDFSKDFNKALITYAWTGLLNRHLWGIPFAIIEAAPAFVAKRLNPAAHRMMSTINECALYSLSKPPVSHEKAEDVVQAMLTSKLPQEEKRFARVLAECRSVIVAGQETTATVLTSLTFHLLSNPDMLAKLRADLEGAYAAKKGPELEYTDVKNLPYLTGVINEALRSSFSVAGRLVRSSPVADLNYQQYSLPRGTYISIHMADGHMDPSIYPEPEKFLPERWLNPAEYKRLNKYLQPWGRGSRLCLGIDLAMYDLYMIVARLFGPERGFDMELFETERKDWDFYADVMAPMPVPGATGLRVKILPLVK